MSKEIHKGSKNYAMWNQDGTLLSQLYTSKKNEAAEVGNQIIINLNYY
jgi:hypothetical protein